MGACFFDAISAKVLSPLVVVYFQPPIPPFVVKVCIFLDFNTISVDNCVKGQNPEKAMVPAFENNASRPDAGRQNGGFHMKKVLSLVLAAVLAASLSACGGALVDLDTPKSEELTAQYDFYPDAMNTIRADMKITPEQADEVFIILTSCGLDGKITSISESKGAYTVYYGGSSLDVALSDGAVEAVYSGRDMLYPEYHKHNVLMDYDLTVKDVKTGSGDKIGEYAYIRITKAQLQAITEENYKEFVETVVKDSSYNWVAILCDDGTGICFPGSMYYVGTYGKQDTDGSILEDYGAITLDENGGYTYEQF